MSDELKPCPFCNAEMQFARNPAYLWHPHGVKCVLSNVAWFFDSGLWNTRAESAEIQRLKGELEAAKADYVLVTADFQTWRNTALTLGEKIESQRSEFDRVMDARQEALVRQEGRAIKIESDLAAQALALKEARSIIKCAMRWTLDDGSLCDCVGSPEGEHGSLCSEMRAFLSTTPSAYEDRAEKLIAALAEQVAGAEWRKENEPENWNGADDEALERAKAALKTMGRSK